MNTDKIFHPNYAEMVKRSDIHYRGAISFAPYGIPVANGRFGGPIWEADEATLSMQLNHTDTFMYNDASANSMDESGCLGQLYLDFKDEVFCDNLIQHLDLYKGLFTLKGDAIKIDVIACTDKDVVMMRVEENRSLPKEITISLKCVRPLVVERNLFSAISVIEPDERKREISLKQTFREECTTGIRTNTHICATRLSVSVEGRDYTLSEKNDEATLILPAGNGDFTIVIKGQSVINDIGIQKVSLDELPEADSFANEQAHSESWWANFWEKSYVYLPDLPEYEMRWTYYMYLAAIANRGQFPGKYNGCNWIAQGDRRDWGCWYWNWNQDSLFQPLNQANHMELMDPLFEMRERCYKQYKVAAKQLWGIENEDALFIGETCGILGFETLPDDVAEELRAYFNGEGERTDNLKSFGENRNLYLVPWNWRLSESNVSYVTHTMVATQETAEYYWQRYCYTLDKEWLKEHAYPFMKGAAELYRNYPGFVKEKDGCYHVYRTNLHEHIWGGKDVIDDLILARGTLRAVIKASEILQVDEEKREVWKEFLEHLAPYPLVGEEDAIHFVEGELPKETVWAQGRKPTALLRGLDGTESPKFKMLEKYDLLNMETYDQGKDNEEFQIALNTFYLSPGYQNQYLDSFEDKNGSSRFLEDAAKLGRAKELEKMFATQYQMFQNAPNRLHDQGDYYSAEGYGAWAAAIQQALMQSLAPAVGEEEVIRVFPAWPCKWDAKFKLLAKGGFEVSSEIEKKQVKYIAIKSLLGSVCRIRNPWYGNVKIYRNGTFCEEINASVNEIIEFKTDKNEEIVIQSI